MELRSSTYDAGIYRERSASLPMHDRGTFKSFGKGKSSIQYNAEPQTAELLLGAITAAVNPFLQNLYHVSQSTKLGTPEHGETWRRNVMNN